MSERDKELGDALAGLSVPEPPEQFWESLRVRCAEAFGTDTSPGEDLSSRASAPDAMAPEATPHLNGLAASSRPAPPASVEVQHQIRRPRVPRPRRREGATRPSGKPAPRRRRRTYGVLRRAPRVMTVAIGAVMVTLAGSLFTGQVRRAEAVAVVPFSLECGRDGNAPIDNGQRLVVAGVWTQDSGEADKFVKVLEAFKKRSGAGVIYTYVPTVRDMAPVLRKRIENGCPPDVAFLSQPGLFRDLARDQSLRPIEGVAADEVNRNYTPAGREFGVVDDVLYGVWFKAANKSMIWYRPDAFEHAELPKSWEALKDAAARIHDQGLVAPFSLAGADGWTLTDWFENVYLATAGPEMYDQLAHHAIPWTDPSVKQALTTLAEIFGQPDWLAGGTEGALQTRYERSVEDVLGPSPKAAMVYEGDFVAGKARELAKGSEGNVTPRSFDFPAIRGSKPLVVGGDVAVSLTKNEAGTKLIGFLATPNAAEVWAREGGFLSPNKSLDPSVYPDDVTRNWARALTQDQTWRFDLSDVQPSGFGATEGMWQLFQDFLRNPRDVDGVAEKLEDKARAVWGPPLPVGSPQKSGTRPKQKNQGTGK
jgi:alpha-glucoside transport system substrate-binding protein